MIGQQFEYAEVQYHFVDRPVVKKFVTVLDEFAHHYSGKIMRYCRIEHIGSICGVDMVEYIVIDEDRFGWMLENKCVEVQ